MSAGQNFRLVPSSANIPATPRPTPRPHAKPRPRPSPRPSKKCKGHELGCDDGHQGQDKHHNCCGGGANCGQVWCKYSGSCKGVWEECSKDDEPMAGGDVDKHACKASAGESWCSKQGKCTRSWEC